MADPRLKIGPDSELPSVATQDWSGLDSDIINTQTIMSDQY